MSVVARIKVRLDAVPARSLAVAESLTCGHVQARLGAISGASTFLRGGITAYTLEQKVAHLGVDRAEAEACECVSETVARQMARGAVGLFGANLAVATTGYAEANPANGVPVPFAWWAVAERLPDGSWVERSGRIDCPGMSRPTVQAAVADAAVAALAAHLDAGPP